MLEVLAHALRAFAVPALVRERLLGDIAIGRIGCGGGDRIVQRCVNGVDIVDETLGCGIRESLPVGSVVGDRPAVGLVAADGELDHPHAEGLGRGGDGGVGDAVDPRGAEIGGQSVATVGHNAAAHAVPGFEHEHVPADAAQQAGGGQSRDPRSDHDRVVVIHSGPPVGAVLRPHVDAIEPSRGCVRLIRVISDGGCPALGEDGGTGLRERGA